jgi:hypothetical protein
MPTSVDPPSPHRSVKTGLPTTTRHVALVAHIPVELQYPKPVFQPHHDSMCALDITASLQDAVCVVAAFFEASSSALDEHIGGVGQRVHS